MNSSQKQFCIDLQADWTLVRLKNIAQIRYGLGQPPPEKKGGVAIIRATNISAGKIIDKDMIYVDETQLPLGRAPFLKKDEIIVVRSGAYTGDSAIIPENYVRSVAGYDMVVTVTHADPKFVAYALLSDYVLQGQILLMTLRAAQAHLNAGELGSIVIAIPKSREKQAQIASYLDNKCAMLDTALAVKRRQLETLESLHMAIVHDAFVELKESPQERIKDIVLKITSGITPEGGATNYLDSGIPLLRSQNVHFDGLHLEDVAYISEETHKSMSNSQLRPKDVLLNITGASIGRCTFVPDNFDGGNVNQHVCVIRPGPKVDYRYLTAFLSSPLGQAQVLSTFTGASRQGLSHKELGLIRLPLPSLDIQKKTLDKVLQAKERKREISHIINSQVEILINYRKSFIHECVTSQCRVNEQDLKERENYE